MHGCDKFDYTYVNKLVTLAAIGYVTVWSAGTRRIFRICVMPPEKFGGSVALVSNVEPITRAHTVSSKLWTLIFLQPWYSATTYPSRIPRRTIGD